MFREAIGLEKYGWEPSSKVDFCARSVIGGDPNLDTEQVGVPRCIWVEMVEMGRLGRENCLYVFFKKKGKLEGNLEMKMHLYGSYVWYILGTCWCYWCFLCVCFGAWGL